MTTKEFFDKEYPRDEYRTDQWVTNYDQWRKECTEFAESYHKAEVESISDEVKYLQHESKEAIEKFTELKSKYPRIATIDVIKLIERLKNKLDNIQQLLNK